ncbi:MAG: hypothetical protein OXI39_03520 [Gemmatimonadota bacterium]|uniref:hypothetical protein n=1 Tax=Candidatus Palauibacter scopulicola TaxID=3056741 RepID=UPI002387C635|nr:hypothetical protein [Candidatus Palauibacter scopulicola]MDE2662061.1 hypothetical protein [Candidatus Palauibacter scopulicola]
MFPGALLRASGPAGAALAIGLALGLTPGPAQGAGSPHPVPPQPRQEVTVDTLEGGRILVGNPAPGRGGGPDEWRLVEELRLGEVDGAGPEVFGNVHDVAVDERGNIYVLDYGSKEVRVFDREGRHLRSMARDGEGPGEFRYSGFSAEYRIVWQPPNRLWVADRYQQLSFDSLGNELTRVGAPFGPGTPISGTAMRDGLRRGTIAAADGSGFIYQQVRVTDRTTSGDETVSRSRTYGVRVPISPEHPNPVLPRDSVLLDSRVSTSTTQTQASGDGNITIGGTIKVSIPRRVWAFTHGETVWAANRAAHRFHEVTFAGDTVRTLELGNPPSPPPDDSDDSEFEPLIASLEVSPEGWLWALRHREDPDESPVWDLFDNCGRYRGEVSSSTRIAAPRFGGEEVAPIDLGAGGVIHGIARDALDVSFVVRLRLQSTSGTAITAEACRW